MYISYIMNCQYSINIIFCALTTLVVINKNLHIMDVNFKYFILLIYLNNFTKLMTNIDR